jgi:hypothetical protein
MWASTAENPHPTSLFIFITSKFKNVGSAHQANE